MTAMKRRALRAPLAVVLASWLVAWGAGAEEPAAASDVAPTLSCAERVAARVQAHYEGIRDLSARFEQTTRSVTLGNASMAGDAPTRGTVVFVKPGRMRWSYEEPTPSLMVSDGSTLWLYDPEAREASRLPVDESYLTGAALQFLMGDGRILESFRITAKTCADDAPGAVEIDLVPRAAASYERMALRADARSGAVDQTTIVDLFGNVTHIRFREVRFNTSPDAGIFQFEPPKGVTVVDLLTPP